MSPTLPNGTLPPLSLLHRFIAICQLFEHKTVIVQCYFRHNRIFLVSPGHRCVFVFLDVLALLIGRDVGKIGQLSIEGFRVQDPSASSLAKLNFFHQISTCSTRLLFFTTE